MNKKDIWGINVIGPQGVDSKNDFAINAAPNADDVVVRVNNSEITGSTIGLIGGKDLNAYSKIKQISTTNKYIYELNYDYINYEYIYKDFAKYMPADIVAPACTSCRKGNLYARNFDYYYSEEAEFIIKIPRINDRFASVSVARLKGLMASMVLNREQSDQYRILPFYAVDGINEFGVFCNINVVPIKDNPNPVSIIGPSDKPKICNSMIVRYVLDHYKTADEAVAGLQNDIQIWTDPRRSELGFEAHWMIGDANKTYVVEIYNGEFHIIDNNIMTNFYQATVPNIKDIQSLYSAKDIPTHSPSEQGILPFGAGIERYNFVKTQLSSVTGVDDMIDLMSGKLDNDNKPIGLAYTNTYFADKMDDSFWFSEYVGEVTDEDGEYLTNDSSMADFRNNTQIDLIIANAEDAFVNQNRNKQYQPWMTLHSSIYDLDAKKLYLISQEGTLDNHCVYECGFDEFSQNDIIPSVPTGVASGVYCLIATLDDAGQNPTFSWQLMPNNK